jgi:hypothetical protein
MPQIQNGFRRFGILDFDIVSNFGLRVSNFTTSSPLMKTGVGFTIAE